VKSHVLDLKASLSNEQLNHSDLVLERISSEQHGKSYVIDLKTKLSNEQLNPMGLVLERISSELNIETYSNDTDKIEENNNILITINSDLSDKSNISNKSNNIINYEYLNKLKLGEIKELAKDKNILLLKNNKYKNKQELINEILEKNI